MPEFLCVQVNIPPERLSEFYLMFGAWLDEEGAPEIPSNAWDPDKGTDWKFDQNEDFTKAVSLWRHLSENAKDIFSLLMLVEEDVVSAVEVADRVGLRSPNAVAGALTWPARYANQMERPLPIHWDKDEEGGTRYWMPVAYIPMFRLVKQLHESSEEEQAKLLEEMGFTGAYPIA